MAYLTEVPSTRRYATFAAVAALHAGIGAALLATFAGGVFTETIRQSIKDHWITPDPMPSPSPLPQPSLSPSAAATRDTKVVAPKPDIDLGLPTGGIDTLARLDPLPTGAGDGDLMVLPKPLPSPGPTARFTPKGAAPRGNPGLWVTTNDYPSDAIRRGEQGTTGVRLTIGPDGRVRDCTVTASSGSPSLDAAACQRMSQRARFQPATDGNGDAIAGTWSNSVKWVLPD